MTRFDEAVFRATHNSFSGKRRGSLVDQLDSGVRFLEFDVNDGDYRRYGYRIGHGKPGFEVDHEGSNPDGNELEAWLAVVAEWSAQHSGHAPITITLDAKNDLTDGRSFADGNFAAMNALLEQAFGERLLRAHEVGDGAWPALEDLRGRILCVLSGSRDGRLGYVRDGGYDPAVALSPSGAVVEVHDSGLGDLWYWTGRVVDGRVRWARHGRYADGSSPSVAVSGAGAVVSVHRSGDGAGVCVGRLDLGSLEIEWTDAREAPLPDAASEPAPDVRFVEEGVVRVTYATADGRMAHGGRVAEHAIEWNAPDAAESATPADARYHRNHAVARDAEVSVVAVPDGHGGTTLLCATAADEAEPIRYEQVLFVEGKAAGGSSVHDLEPIVAPDGPRFFATGASGSGKSTWGEKLRAEGKLVRLWGFDEAASKRKLVPNFPACDLPAADWYASYCDSQGALEPPA